MVFIALSLYGEGGWKSRLGGWGGSAEGGEVSHPVRSLYWGFGAETGQFAIDRVIRIDGIPEFNIIPIGNICLNIGLIFEENPTVIVDDVMMH